LFVPPCCIASDSLSTQRRVVENGDDSEVCEDHQWKKWTSASWQLGRIQPSYLVSSACRLVRISRICAPWSTCMTNAVEFPCRATAYSFKTRACKTWNRLHPVSETRRQGLLSHLLVLLQIGFLDLKIGFTVRI
jgi:hypothetical protein